MTSLALTVAAGVSSHTGRFSEVAVADSRVLIPAGWFTFGATAEEQEAALALCMRDLGKLERACTPDLAKGEGPPRSVFLPGFFIDKREVTVAAYRRCVAEGPCDPRPLLDADPRFLRRKLPITRVSWFDAQRYCSFVGGRLPTETEWERAARGNKPRIFPWGDALLPTRSNHGRFQVLDAGSVYARPMVTVDEQDGYAFLADVGSFPEGASPEGVLDLAGNATEWVADEVGDEGPQRGVSSLPAPGARRMLRGGSFRQPLFYQRTTSWDAAMPDLRSPEVGFRCASERAIERR